MASYIERGDSLFIPFRDGVSISDSQCRPRMYKSVQNFEKSFPTHNLGNKNMERGTLWHTNSTQHPPEKAAMLYFVLNVVSRVHQVLRHHIVLYVVQK